ncbi:MAG TPA: DNA polymerase III subunit beta [Parvularcula sp.]|nr:DNA polymerase III subunit beta [Parvularcula sp.]HBS35177.1 DNA polymerase III subunit beta [Parvularcula sp.]
MHPLIAEKLEDIKRLCRERAVKRLEIFGSAARGDDFDPDKSDADFIVDFCDWHRKPWLGAYFDFERALAALLGRDVNRTQLGAVKNIYVQQSIDQDRELTYAG